ncbi:MAG: T9SS type A sorting domain-containing protein [Bacteroidales bacterium]|nr:T9SS type A sorting domain-containing protein [Bacteroidales bacterium]
MAFLCLILCNAYAQTQKSDDIEKQTRPFTAAKFTIEANSSFQNLSNITITDTLWIYGTLINDGNISAKTCIVENGTILSNEFNELNVEQNLIFKNALTKSSDTVHIITFSADSIFINDYTTMESAYLTAKNLIVNDTLEFTGKLGVKTIYSNLIINGTLLNSDNENIQLYGNAINSSSATCKKMNIKLYGENNYIQGNFSCYRFDLETSETIYTNYDSLTVTDFFSGKGTLIQGVNAYLSVNSQTTPYINALALGNTIEYTRGGKQTLNTNECFNLIVSKKGGATLHLTQNLKINNSLILNKKAFVNCETHKLQFPDITEYTLPQSNYSEEKGIFLNNGEIILNNFDKNETVWLPLFTNDTCFAGFSIKNLDDSNNSLSIDSLFNIITETGKSNSDSIIYDFVSTTWHISSQIKAYISFDWSIKKEQEYFDRDYCTVYRSTGNSWKDVGLKMESSTFSNETQTNADGYFTIGNNPVLLPINLEYFKITQTSNFITILWKTQPCNKRLFIEKSFDGIHFYTIAEIPNGENCYKDKKNESGEIIYYRLKQEDNNGTCEYSEIKSIYISQKVDFSIEDKKITTSTDSKNTHLQLFTIYGKLVNSSKTNIISIENIPCGIYILKIKTESSESVHKISI